MSTTLCRGAKVERRRSRTSKRSANGVTSGRVIFQCPKPILSRRLALPDPCSASRPSPLRGSPSASLDPSARLRPLSAMVFADRPGLLAGSAQQRSWLQHAASDRRSHPEGRSEAEHRRRRLTAPGRCGHAPRAPCVPGVMPACAGIQSRRSCRAAFWIPAFAGMTGPTPRPRSCSPRTTRAAPSPSPRFRRRTSARGRRRG